VTLIRDGSTGAIERIIRAPADIKELVNNYQVAAVNGNATAAAIIGGRVPSIEGAVKLVNLQTGGSRTIGGGAADGVAFSDRSLLVQRSSGVLEVWDDTGTHLLRSIPGDPDYEVSPVANSQGTLVAQERYDGTVRITDLRSGETLGSFRLPSPAKSGMAFTPDGRMLLTVTDDLPTVATQPAHRTP
jgi:WD40 repeat protein